MPGNTTPAAEARIYLPVLLESYKHSSAFDVGQQVRQIAYSLLGAYSTRPLGHVWEFKRVQPGQRSGSRVDLLERPQLQEAISKLVGRLENIRVLERDEVRVWLYFILWQEMNLSYSLGRDSVGATLLRWKLPTSIKHDEGTRARWDLVHFKAQVDACLYSFRILRQILEQVPKGPQGMEDPAVSSSLRRQLSTLPLLDAFPHIEEIINFSGLARGSPAAAAIAEEFGIQAKSSQPGPCKWVETCRDGKEKHGAALPSTRTRIGVYHNFFYALTEDIDD
jgi:hypothetical protein